jgi:O-antigen/teichoic acid export membrane protein
MEPQPRPTGSNPLPAVDEGFSPIRSLTASVAAGLRWQLATQLVNEGTRAASVIVVARLLTPTDYGVAGLALVFASLTSVISDPALGTALMRRPRISELDRSTVFWSMLLVGTVLTVGGVAASGLVAEIVGQPEVKRLFAVLSLTFVISCASVTQIALFNRDLSFRALQIRQMCAVVIGGSVGVVCASLRLGPWAIVGNQVAYTTASALLVWLMSPWRPKWVFSFSSLRELGSFGSKLYAADLLGWSQENADNALVGRVLGSAALGTYALAYNLMFVPLQRISQPIMQVMAPAYSRLQDDPVRLERVWLRSKRLSASLLTPAFFGCIVVGPDLVPVVFGEKWHAAVLPLQLLCLAGLAQTLVTLDADVLAALGHGGSIFSIQIVTSTVTVAAFVAGLPFGIIGVAGFFAASRWILVVVEVRMTTRAAGFSFRAALRAGTESLPAGLLAVGVGFGARTLLMAGQTPAAARLVLVGALVVGVYAALMFLFARDVVDELRDVSARRRRVR